MTYTAGEWHYDTEDWASEPARIVSIDHEKSELTLMDAKPKAPTVQAVIAAYEALYDHKAVMLFDVDADDGKLRAVVGWQETCSYHDECDYCSKEIELSGDDHEEVVLGAYGETLDEVLADLAAQLREEAQTPVARFDKVLGLLAT